MALNRSSDIDWDVVADRLQSREISNYSMAITWLWVAARFVSKRLPMSVDGPNHEFPLLRTEAWRLSAYRSRWRNKSWTRKLLAEGLRAEFDMKLEGPVPYTPFVHKMRRTTSAAAARLTYGAWRKFKWKDTLPSA